MDRLNSVLIIDDDEDDIFLIQDRLSSLTNSGCHFLSCSKKEDAVKYLKERTFDICILDYRLAGYKGLDVLEAVANAQLATPIIMLTGQEDKEVAKDAIRLGAQDFVPKSCIDEDIFEKSILYAISRKELEFAKLLGQRKESENVAKDKFIAHLSHELRTPLTSILGYTSLLLEKEEAVPLQKELTIISNNGKHLLNLLNDVLDLSKIAAGKFELREQKNDLQQILAEINSLLCVTALDKGLSLEFKTISKIPRIITIDDLRFKQVLVNLIGNAIKFTDSGSVKVTLDFVDKDPTPKLKLKITDTGIGMDKQQIKTIFAPFKQIEDVANRKAGGAGLGLSISAEIVKQMGGKVQVESVLGEGSIFSLSFPCKYEPQELILYDFNLESDQIRSSSAPNLTGRVLVVDDIFEIRQLAGYFVKQSGASVQFANNGEQAVSMVKEAISQERPFDLVLMDLHMPVMTGKKAMSNIKLISPEALVFAMTAAINKGLYEEIMALGFTGLIGKPIDKYQLWEILQQHLPSAVNSPTPVLSKSKVDKTNAPIVHLVEDDIDSAQIMSLIIASLGYQVIHSQTAAKALQHAKNQNIAIHLVDLGLPDLSGEALIAELFNAPISGSVYIVSGDQPNPRILEQYPIKQHLIKPISKNLLAKILA